MLIRCGDTADVKLGRQALALLRDSSWIRRRVETIRFVDQLKLQQRVTVDVSMARAIELETTTRPETDSTADESTPYVDDNYRPVPLTLLQKQLLTDFDLLDPAGRALPCATRVEDVYYGWSALLALASEGGPSRSFW